MVEAARGGEGAGENSRGSLSLQTVLKVESSQGEIPISEELYKRPKASTREKEKKRRREEKR